MKDILPFILESEKLKSVLRRTKPVATERRENSAEHSWTLALMAISIFPNVGDSLDKLRVLKMLLLHDLIEIDAGDTFCYDKRPDKEASEFNGAKRIFGLLPDGVSEEFLDLWLEFEAFETEESRFANALDRLIPLIQNFNNEGQSWKEHGITFEQAYARNESIREGSQELWDFALQLLNEAADQGLLPKQAEQGVAPNP